MRRSCVVFPRATGIKHRNKNGHHKLDFMHILILSCLIPSYELGKLTNRNHEIDNNAITVFVTNFSWK